MKFLAFTYGFFLVSAIILPGRVSAQTYDILEIPRISHVDFDGMPDEEGWNAIQPLPMVQYEPNAGAPPTQKTEIRFAYDDNYFYGSIRAYDPDKFPVP